MVSVNWRRWFRKLAGICGSSRIIALASYRTRSLANTLTREREKMHVVTIVNQKGGVGKSMTSANLGSALSRTGLRVLAIDLDPQGTLTRGTLGDRSGQGTAEALGYGISASEEPPSIASFATQLLPSALTYWLAMSIDSPHATRASARIPLDRCCSRSSSLMWRMRTMWSCSTRRQASEPSR